MDLRILHSPLDNYGLHRFALQGDDEGVRRALREGADINALDEAGRTVLMCAVAGEHWQDIDAYDASFMSSNRLNSLKIILNHPDITLLTLNSTHPSMNGVIPLGMAAWLNQPQAVRTLLEESLEFVSVDGMDSHGATALMYAARDGSLEVVQELLRRGARPDFRDRNHRTSIQFSLTHPQVLWLCEMTLRVHRWRESNSADRSRLSTGTEYLVHLACSSLPSSGCFNPPPSSIFTPEATSRLTNALISSIRSSDLSFIHSVLFSPALHASSPPALYPMSVPVIVNLPDANGWSLVHHCVAMSQPSIDILDALYCAGADISLFTIHEEQTPLHILARSAGSFSCTPELSQSLHEFCLHLIQDLCAPLSARDKDDETCLHIAAEHGHSVDMLILLLDCDTTGVVRKMRNSRGLTPFEVAKKEFAFAFSNSGDGRRSKSALSNYTIRPTGSFASLSSVSELRSFHTLSPPVTPTDVSSIYSPMDIDVDAAIQQLLSSLRTTSLSGHHATRTAHIQHLESCLEDTMEQCNAIVQHFRGRLEDASRAVRDLRKNAERIDSVRNVVALAANGKLVLRGISPIQSKKRGRDSEDSQLTFVQKHEIDDVSSCYKSPSDSEGHISIGTQTSLLDRFVASNIIPHPDSSWLDTLVESSDSPATSKARLHGLWEIERGLMQLQRDATSPTKRDASPTKVAMKLKQVLKKKKKLEDQIQELDWDLNTQKKDASFGTARVKAWLKRMVVSHQPPNKIEVVLDLEENSNVGHEVKSPQFPSTKPISIDSFIDTALQTSGVVLEVAHRDLLSINQCLEAAQRFIDSANHSISRTERVVKRAVKKREAMIADLRSAATRTNKSSANGDELSPSLLGYDNAISQRPSMASISTIYSTTSSVSSVATTVAENDDEDIRIIRRLLLRKIEAQVSGGWDEVDSATSWLHIVKEAVRSVKRRAYL